MRCLRHVTKKKKKKKPNHFWHLGYFKTSLLQKLEVWQVGAWLGLPEKSWSVQQCGTGNWPSFKAQRPRLPLAAPWGTARQKQHLCPTRSLSPWVGLQDSLLLQETHRMFLWRTCCVEATGKGGWLQGLPTNPKAGVHLRSHFPSNLLFLTRCFWRQACE